METTTVKERPILFSGEMVRAILDGRKTMTRRILKDQSVIPTNRNTWPIDLSAPEPGDLRCPYGKPGERMWVRETWRPHRDPEVWTSVQFKADGAVMKPTTWTDEQGAWCEENEEDKRWRNPIHMPRWASRITLEITGVKVERVQNISEADAQAEGIERLELTSGILEGVPPPFNRVHPMTSSYRDAFASHWGKGKFANESWEANPWVWCISFRRVNS